MRTDCLIASAVGCLACASSLLAGLSPVQIAQLPPPASDKVEFGRDIRPLLEARCVQCHGRGKAKGGFSLQDSSTALKGGSSGAVIIPGHSEESYLIELVSGLDPDNVMPAKGTRLTTNEVGMLRAWIDQGVAWDAGVGFGRPPARNLMPRRPELPPAGAGSTHPIDRFTRSYFESEGVTVPSVVDDAVYIRRVYLDAVGLIPPPEEVERFCSDSTIGKRGNLVRRLLADRAGYAVHWLTFWNDALRNDYQGTGYIDGGRRPITQWLYRALAENMPFDRFVRELVDPGAESEGFINGIVWRGVVNASQTPEMQAAQNVSQIFMGVNLKCASCHDSFINDWTLSDAYGLAGVYSLEPLEMVHCDKPTGQVAPLRFLYPELGEIDARLPRKERLKELANLLTEQQNGRLSRTIVNRFWARLLGRGLVEPVDDMEQLAWAPDLLDWLAADLTDHAYDLKRTLELILTSQAYQLPAVPAAEQAAEGFVFRGPAIRRLSAEQYLDAVSEVTGVWNSLPAARLNFDLEDEQQPPDSAHWIWKDPDARKTAAAETVYWRKMVDLPAVSAGAIVLVCDNSFKLFVNGRELASGGSGGGPQVVDVGEALVKGANAIAIEAKNESTGNKSTPESAANPAGLLAEFIFRRELESSAESDREEAFRMGTDPTWRWSLNAPEGWQEAGFKDSAWAAAVELGPYR